MTRIKKSPGDTLPETVYAAYADNVCRHLIALARETQRRLMQACLTAGFQGLKLSFGQVLPFVPPQGVRIGELAQLQGVSKQAMSQLVKELESLGYVVTEEDAQDRRVRQVKLSERGLGLFRESSRAVGAHERELEQCLGSRRLRTFNSQLIKLGHRVAPELPWPTVSTTGAAAMALGVLSQYCSRRLMEILRSGGHPSLKMSYGGVLTHLGREGARISDLAEINDISKQAIAQVVAELEQLDYVHCLPDPADGRAKRVFLGGQGIGLIRDSVAAVSILQDELGEPMNSQEFVDSLKRLYQALCTQDHLQPTEEHEGDALCELMALWREKLSRQERERLFTARGSHLRLSEEALQLLKDWSAPVGD